jgi:hypothetical protein
VAKLLKSGAYINYIKIEKLTLVSIINSTCICAVDYLSSEHSRFAADPLLCAWESSTIRTSGSNAVDAELALERLELERNIRERFESLSKPRCVS